jgi:hypothetical protein
VWRIPGTRKVLIRQQKWKAEEENMETVSFTILMVAVLEGMAARVQRRHFGGRWPCWIWEFLTINQLSVGNLARRDLENE